MSIKEDNEITVKVTCSNEKLINMLIEKKFKPVGEFTLDDYYLIPKSTNLENLTTREILAKAVIVRYVVDGENIVQKITFKKKNINEKGEIISQKAINCNVIDYKDALNLLNEIGYYEIMNIKERDVVYSKDNIELAVKFIENMDTLIEIETNDEFDTVEKLKNLVKSIKVPIEKDNFFVKKAEITLSKILNK